MNAVKICLVHHVKPSVVPQVNSKTSKSHVAKFAILVILLICQFNLSAPAAIAQRADADVLVAQAVLAYDDGHYGQALDLLNKALEFDPQETRGLYYKGLVLLAQKEPERAIDPLEAARKLRPKDPHVKLQLGVAYFTIGNYERAGPLLEGLFQENPNLENVGYYVGFIRYRNQNYSKAVEALKQVHTSDPNIKQLALFYQGLAQGILGLPDQAIAELEEVQRTQAVSPITGAAVRIREALAAGRKPEEGKRLRLQVSLGGYYDDNVPINPDPTGPIPHRFPGTLANPNTTIASLRNRHAPAPGMLTSILADYAFLRKGPIEATATYSFFQNLNFNGLDRFNIQDHLVGVAGFYRGTVANVPYQLAAQYNFDYLFLDQAAFLSRHTPTATATIVPPTIKVPVLGEVGNLTTALVRYQVKSFFREPGDSDPRFSSELRDAFNTMLGFVHAFRFDADTYVMRLGYQYDSENAEGAPFSFNGDRLLTGGSVALPWGDIRVRYDYDVHWRDYKNPQSLFVDRDGFLVPRADIQQTHLIQVVKPLPLNLSFTLQFQGIQNESNIPIYDFTKNIFSGIVTWTY